jgi:hypothetical protein
MRKFPRSNVARGILGVSRVAAHGAMRPDSPNMGLATAGPPDNEQEPLERTLRGSWYFWVWSAGPNRLGYAESHIRDAPPGGRSRGGALACGGEADDE